MKRSLPYKIVLLIFFVLYALSPLTYDLCATPLTSKLSGETSERSIRTATLYLIEALYEAFFLTPAEPENEPSPNRIPIKKKSALLRSRFDPVPHAGRNGVVAETALTLSHHFIIGSERAELLLPRFGKNSRCLPLTSGLSPPFCS